MSLDVYLTLKDKETSKVSSGIFIREDGRKKEISREEWDKRFPDREPVVATIPVSNEVYSGNITHNLTDMAGEAGIYDCLWRPSDVQIAKAKQLIKPLEEGLARLKANPVYFKTFDSSNGWGVYEDLVGFVEEYLNACKKYPEAEVRVWV